MGEINIVDVKGKIETKYQAGLARLDRARQSLERWRQEKLSALDVLSGEKSVDEWLEDRPVVKENVSAVVPAAHLRFGVMSAKASASEINQAAEIRNAVKKLGENISNTTIMTWFQENKSEIAPLIQQRSIRAELWRLQKKGELEFVGKDGVLNVYKIAGRSQFDEVPPENS